MWSSRKLGQHEAGGGGIARNARHACSKYGQTHLAFYRLRAPLALVLLVTVGGCARPTGDFGRAEPSVIHDKVMPAVGGQIARARGESVSKFNLTNDEKLLRNLGWGLIRPPSSEDWIQGTRVELMRTRILPEENDALKLNLYYYFLRSANYRSSDARYARVAADATGDAELVPPFCEVAVRVSKADDERLRALGRNDIPEDQEYFGAQARVWENRKYTEWVMLALRYRLKAYREALDKLEVETPSEHALWDANSGLKRLSAAIVNLEKGCPIIDRYGQSKQPKRSRIYTGWGTERPPVKK